MDSKNVVKFDVVKFDGYSVFENDDVKILHSETFHNLFNKKTGLNVTYGKTKEENPDVSPFGPLIADIEVTTICYGPTDTANRQSVCKFCYKSNTPNGKNMPLETFKKVIDKLAESRSLTQIAIGADASATSNPELFEMMDYSRSKGIVPNITVADISEETAKILASKVGACAVSRYANKETCYNSIEKLTRYGLNQVNIHILVSENSYEWIVETMNDKLSDPRLKGLNAIVLLSLKKKGRGETFEPLSQEKFKKLVDFALKMNIAIGFDSCSCFRFLDSVKDHPQYKQFEMCGEPCESGRMSIYIDVDGKAYPCSFSPDRTSEKDCLNWQDGIDVASCDNFIKDIWNHPKLMAWKKNLIANNKNGLGCIECPLYKI